MEYQKCSKCCGKGYIRLEGTKKLQVCAGGGGQSVSAEADIICKYCEGLGIEINLACEECGGIGQLESIRDVQCADCQGKGILVRLSSNQAGTCPNCKGKGFTSKISSKTCSTCRGMGVLRQPNISVKDVIRLAYWQIIQVRLSDYKVEHKVLGIKLHKTKYMLNFSSIHSWDTTCIKSIPLEANQVSVGQPIREKVTPILEQAIYELINDGWEKWDFYDAQLWYSYSPKDITEYHGWDDPKSLRNPMYAIYDSKNAYDVVHETLRHLGDISWYQSKWYKIYFRRKLRDS